jgi:DNA-binding CsgD family transcriptional regulator/predicted DNA-binding transcriptional regulator
MHARKDEPDVPDGAALRAVGIGDDEERVYRWLLVGSPAAVGDVAVALGVPRAHAAAALDALEAKGLLARAGPGGRRLVPEPPDLAIERLILRRREELEQARQAAAGLAASYREPLLPDRPEVPVEIAMGATAVRRQVAELAGAATDELLFLSAGEEAWPLDAGDGRGRVRRRVIFGPEALEGARVPSGGMEARCAGEVPVTLMVADRRAAVVALPAGPRRPLAGGAVVRPSALLDALIALFDLLWSRAVPVGPSDGDAQLLALLLAGLTDQGMARQLGCSVRTVQRRVRDLMSRWGVRTRPQLVWRAAREGWLA